MADVTPRASQVFTREKQEAVLQLVSDGVYLQTALVQVGLNERIVDHWEGALAAGHWTHGGPVSEESLAEMAQFVDRLAQAEAVHEAFLVQSIHKAVGQVNEKTGLIDTKPAEFLLTHGRARERWRKHDAPNAHTMVTVNSGGAQQARAVRDLTDAQLIELGDDEWRELLPDGGPSTD